MAYSKTARDVLFFDLTVQRRATQAPFPPLSEIFPLWEKASLDIKFPVKKFLDGSVTAIIKDYANDPVAKTITMLVEVSDRNAPDSTYLDHDTRGSRHNQKKKSEGNGFSAHIFISTEHNKGVPNTYLTFVEAIPNVSIQRIQSTLNSVIRHFCEKDGKTFTYQRPGGSQKLLPFVPHIALAGVPSDQFIADIERGKIHGMTLVNTVVKQPAAASAFVKFEEASLKVRVSKNIPKGQRWKTLLDTAKSKKVDFPTARIWLQPEEGGKSGHVDVDADTGKIIGEAYVKTKRISAIDPPIENTSPDKIVAQFAAKAAAIMKQERR